MSITDTRADLALEFIAARLGRNPDISARSLYQQAQSAGVATRKTDFLREVREFKEFLGVPARTQPRPERFISRGATAVASKQRDAAAIVSLARREHGGRIGPALREFNRENPGRAISLDSMRRYGGTAMRKERGRWTATTYDRLERTMRAITTEGVQELRTRDSRTASLIAEHLNAVHDFMRTGDEAQLRRFRGRSFTVGGQRYTLETDPDALLTLDEGGDLDDLSPGT